MELDLSSIDDHDDGSSRSPQQNSDDDFQIQQMGLVGLDDQIQQSSNQNQLNMRFGQQYECRQICLNQVKSSVDRDFVQNIREILITGNGEFSEASEHKYFHQQQDKESSRQFDQPLKGSFLQEMEKLCKTISFQSTVFNIFNPEQSGQLPQGPMLVQLTQKPTAIEQKSRQKLKTKFFWEIPLLLQNKYILDFSKCKKNSKLKKSKMKSMNFTINDDISRNTIASTKSMKKKSKYAKNQTNKSSKKHTERNSSQKNSFLYSSNFYQISNIHKKQNSTLNRQKITMISKKSVCSPLKKIGCTSRNSEFDQKLKKTKQNAQKQVRNKKKIQAKFKF